MSEAVIRLEGFSAPLKGQRLWICGPAQTLGQQIQSHLTVLEEELLNRGRKVLVIQNAKEIPMIWAKKIQWDATFRIKEMQDLRLALTYIQNSVKPSRVVWVGDEPPVAVFSAISSPDITFLGAGTATPRLPWSAVFWHTTSEQSKIEEGLAPRLGQALQALNLPSVLRELKASQVSLVWSSIGESDKTGSVYWYDTEETGNTGTALTPLEMSALLHEIGDWMTLARY
jgi:hypothetical protein